MHYLTLFVLVYTCEMFGFHRYDPRGSQICVNRARETFLVSQEKKEVAKFAYFLEARMYECPIFWMNMMVCINFVVNYVLFKFMVMPGRLSLD